MIRNRHLLLIGVVICCLGPEAWARRPAKEVTDPAVIVYLRDLPASCLHRIHIRNRPYEQRISLDFLEGLDADYEALVSGWKKCPVVRLHTTDIDYTVENAIVGLAEHLGFYVAAAKPEVTG